MKKLCLTKFPILRSLLAISITAELYTKIMVIIPMELIYLEIICLKLVRRGAQLVIE